MLSYFLKSFAESIGRDLKINRAVNNAAAGDRRERGGGNVSLLAVAKTRPLPIATHSLLSALRASTKKDVRGTVHHFSEDVAF